MGLNAPIRDAAQKRFLEEMGSKWAASVQPRSRRVDGMTLDPNWYYSSAAQSGAALVAIIGGFMVTKILSMGAEKATVDHELEVLRKRRVIVDADRSSFQTKIDVDEAEFLIQENWDDIIGTDPPSPTDLAHSDDVLEGDPEHVERIVAERMGDARATAETVKRNVQDLLARSNKIPWDYEAFVSLTEQVPMHNDEYAQRYFRDEVMRLSRDVPGTVAYEAVPILKGDNAMAYERDAHNREQDERRLVRHRRNELRSEVDGMDKQIELLLRRRQSLAVPKQTRQGFRALLVFTITGVLLPLGALMAHPSKPILWLDVAIAVGFVLGLGMVLLYIWQSFKAIEQGQ